ncbi:hypothetical protein ACFLXG_01800 [Chloroflexota bacterium]
MIWLRRTIAIPLALITIIIFLPLLLVFRVDSTLANPDFYNEQLSQVDIYNFLYDDILPAALEEADIGGGTPGDGIDIASFKPQIIGIARQTLPPEWLQVQVEQTINEIIPYVWGDTEDFHIMIPVKDRVETAAQAIKDTLHKEGVFSELYDQGTSFIVDEFAASAEELPPPFTMNRAEFQTAVATLLPMDWTLAQIDGAIDEVTPYFTKDKEQFAIQVDISTRLDDLEEIVIDLLQKPETYDYLFEELVTPALKQNTEEITRLPIGVILTGEEILQAAKEVLPLEWYQARITDIIGQLFAYFKGTEPSLDLVISLADRKPVIASTLSELADQKLKSTIDSLPVCTATQLLEMLLDPPLDRLPECRPLDITYSELKELLGIEMSTVVTPLVDILIPDQLTITDTDLRQMLGGDGDDDMLGQIRELVQGGFTYTSVNLQSDMGADEYRMIEDIRQQIAGGFTFTKAELQELMTDAGSQTEQFQTFNEVRSVLVTVRSWKIAAWLIPVLLLVAIGFLGGRRWSSRLIWAAAVLVIIAIITCIAFGPVFSATAQPMIDEALRQAVGQADSFQSLLTDKGVTIAQNSIDSFVGGIKTQAFILLGVSLGLVAAGIFLRLRVEEK